MSFRDTKSRKDVSATISQGHRFSKSKTSVFCTRRSKNFGCWASLSRLRFEATSIFFLSSSALYPIMPPPLSSSLLSPQSTPTAPSHSFSMPHLAHDNTTMIHDTILGIFHPRKAIPGYSQKNKNSSRPNYRNLPPKATVFLLPLSRCVYINISPYPREPLTWVASSLIRNLSSLVQIYCIRRRPSYHPPLPFPPCSKFIPLDQSHGRYPRRTFFTGEMVEWREGGSRRVWCGVVFSDLVFG